MKKNIFVVEDHPAVRQGIVETINREADLAVCGEADDVLPAVEAIRATRPDLVLIDIQLKSSSGLELIRELRQLFPSLRLIGMTMFDPVFCEKQAHAAGANGFLVKQDGPAKMVAAIVEAVSAEPQPCNSL